jgi:hypothetical protein
MIGIASLLASAGMSLVSNFIDIGKDKAIDVIKDKVGIDLSKKENLTESEILKLKEFEKKNKEFLLSQTKLYLDDMKDARMMQIEALKQEDKFTKRFIYFFAYIWSAFAMVYMASITFIEIPDSSVRFADTIQGFLLGTIVAQIIAFFYGSSIGSKQKTEAMEKGNIK